MRPSEVLGHVLGALGRTADLQSRTMDDVLRGITETAARTLRVARVNIWLYDGERTAIHCIEGYDARAGTHEAGDVLEARDYPNYFAALEVLRTIAAMDAEHDSRTEELAEQYLARHGVVTMLDVPVLRNGNVIGVVCHEHVETPRKWSETDRLFAGSVGDLVALVLENQRHAELELEQARLKEQLARGERLESMAWLAAGIAHDFRNLLTAVLAHGQILARDLEPGRLKNSAGDVVEAALRAQKLCDQLMVYSGKTPSAPETIVIAALVEEVVRVLAAQIPENVTVETEIAPGLPPVVGDTTEVHRAIMNLVVNALDAVSPQGGKVRISVREDTPALLASEEAYDFRTANGRAILVQVEDDGAGMAPATRRRLFQPFFTTKSDGHGFGLPTVLGTVRGHQGALSVETAPGHGATFRLWFPV
jgi:signal transduction histidine kinase